MAIYTRLEYLMEQYVNRTCSEAERQELLQIIREGGQDDVIKAWMETSGVRLSGKYRLGPDASEQILQSILGAEATPVVSLESSKEGIKRRWTWWAAAAVFVLLAGASVYFLQARKEKAAIVKDLPVHQDISPGKNGAILTLADGSTIALDSSKAGVIAAQGGARVVLTDGKLTYNKERGAGIKEVTFNKMSTPRGRQFQLSLPDGTKVWLNAASSITYPTAFIEQDRKVEITGEAYFEVAKNKNMPFIVKVNGMEVKVLGTHFNVNAYSDEALVRTSLLEGSVLITKDSATALLKPGQQAQVNKAGVLKTVNDVDMEEAVAWKNGFFRFNGYDIDKVMRQVSRWYDVQVVYEGKIPDGNFSGVINRNNDISQILKILKDDDVQFRIEGKKVIVFNKNEH